MQTEVSAFFNDNISWQYKLITSVVDRQQKKKEEKWTKERGTSVVRYSPEKCIASLHRSQRCVVLLFALFLLHTTHAERCKFLVRNHHQRIQYEYPNTHRLDIRVICAAFPKSIDNLASHFSFSDQKVILGLTCNKRYIEMMLFIANPGISPWHAYAALWLDLHFIANITSLLIPSSNLLKVGWHI